MSVLLASCSTFVDSPEVRGSASLNGVGGGAPELVVELVAELVAELVVELVVELGALVAEFFPAPAVEPVGDSAAVLAEALAVSALLFTAALSAA